MAFAHWQIERIRRALNNYRIRKSVNGRLASWDKVLLDILTSGVTDHVVAEDPCLQTFKPEALRRFGNGQSILDPLKLKDVRAFLVLRGYLREEEADEESDILGQFMALHGFLSVSESDAKARLQKLGSRYFSQRTRDDVTERLELSFILDPGKTFVRVEEKFEIEEVWPDEAGADVEVKFLAQKTSRKGYGIVSTSQNLLYLFLRGGAATDRINYFELHPTEGKGKSLFLQRSGNSYRMEGVERTDTGVVVSSYNLYCLSDTPPDAKVRHERFDGRA